MVLKMAKILHTSKYVKKEKRQLNIPHTKKNFEKELKKKKSKPKESE